MTHDVRLRGGDDRPLAIRGTVLVSVLGPLAVEADGREVHVAGTHRRRLLALLASRPGRMVSVDAIVDALWGEDPPPTAAKTVQTHVVRLRRSLSATDVELIETIRGGYRLAVDAGAVDAVRFEQLAAMVAGSSHAAPPGRPPPSSPRRSGSGVDPPTPSSATPTSPPRNGSGSTSCACGRPRTSPRPSWRAGRPPCRSPNWSDSSSRSRAANGPGRY